MSAPYRLITIPPSHYCEKARWALDYAGISYREEGHPPLLHRLPVKLAGGGVSTGFVDEDDASAEAGEDASAAAAADAAPGRSVVPLPLVVALLAAGLIGVAAMWYAMQQGEG